MKKILFIIMLFPSLLLGEPKISGSLPQEPDFVVSTASEKNQGKKNYTISAIENIGFIVGLWSYDRYVAKEYWAVIGFNSIEANFRNGFEWDHDGFAMNQIAHPYSGSIYFTAARSNNLSFVESSAYVLGGSLLWESFMENHYPSINDMITTTFGGIALGEVLYRLSNHFYNDNATGTKKVVNEFITTLLCPMNSLNRHLGYSSPKRENSQIQYTFSFGGNNNFMSDQIEKMDSNIFAGFQLEYNKMFQDKKIRKPFDYFKAAIDISLYKGETVSSIILLGHLIGREINQESYSILAGAFQNFYYTNNDIIKLSSSSIGPGVEIKSELTEKMYLNAGFQVHGILLGAMDSRYNEENRDYNLGPGYSILSYLKFGRNDLIIMSISSRFFSLSNVAGLAASERIWIIESGIDFPVYRNLRFGLKYNYFDRQENYDEYADVSGYGDLLRSYLTISF